LPLSELLDFQLASQLISNIFFLKKQGVKGKKSNFALLPKYTQNMLLFD